METGRKRSALRWGMLLVTVLAVIGGFRLLSAPSAPTGKTLSASGQAVASGGNGQTNDNCVANSNGNGNCSGTFSVTVGSAGVLYPGGARQLPLSWNNPNSFDMLVDSYEVSVTSTSKPTCQTSSLQVPPKTTLTGGSRISVGAKKSATTNVSILLLNTTTDACQGASFNISVKATAVKK